MTGWPQFTALPGMNVSIWSAAAKLHLLQPPWCAALEGVGISSSNPHTAAATPTVTTMQSRICSRESFDKLLVIVLC